MKPLLSSLFALLTIVLCLGCNPGDGDGTAVKEVAASSSEGFATLYLIESQESGGPVCQTFHTASHEGGPRSLMLTSKAEPGGAVLTAVFQSASESVGEMPDPLFQDVTSPSSVSHYPVTPGHSGVTGWKYQSESDTEAYVVFIHPEDLRSLAKLREIASDAEALKEWIVNRLRVQRQPESLIVRVEPPSTAGSRHGLSHILSSSWKGDAKKVSFSPDEPGILVFPVTPQ